MELRVEGVEYRYRGDWEGRAALRGVRFSARGPVVGLIGPNGAGKTTLLRCLVGLIRPAHGCVWVSGLDPAAYRRRCGLGYLPEHAPLPPYERVDSFLRAIATLRGRRAADAAVTAVLRWARLQGWRRARIGALSLGLRRRVALAAAELGRPRFLVLDEPTNGLDPLAVHDLRERVAGWRRQGRLVVISSHHLDEVQRLADEVILLWEGRVRAFLSRAQIGRMGPGALDAWFSERPWDPARSGAERACGGQGQRRL